MATVSQLKAGGTSIPVSNLEKVFYPETGFTKGNVINYYIKISPHLLPHLKDRPITLKRYPNGAQGLFFYEKQCPAHRPEWIRTARVTKSNGQIDYCLLDTLPALVWAANLADLELHTFLHTSRNLTRPTAVIFDLDPGPPANILACCQVGLLLEEMLSAMKLRSFAKTSGSKGLQVYVPLNCAVSYLQTKAFARRIAGWLQSRAPDLVVSKMQKSLRAGKVFVDWSQNDPHKTTVAVYSLRAREHPSVSTPVTWKEIGMAVKKSNHELLDFSPELALQRAERLGDLFAPVLKLKQKLPDLAQDG